MRNIVKAQFFQIARDKIIKYIVVVTLLMQTLMVILPILLDAVEVSSAGEFFATSGGSLTSFPLFFLILMTAEICGADFIDKTHNYELLSGHKRIEVYLGRILPALLMGGLSALLLAILPVGIYVVLYGWGTKVAVGQVVIRFLLLLFPLVRLVCEFACLTFLFKNPYVVMGLGYLAFMSTMIITEMIESKCVFLGVTNITWVLMVSKWQTYGLGGDINYIFDASTSAVMVWGTIAASVFFGLAALGLGYIFFKSDDMN